MIHRWWGSRSVPAVVFVLWLAVNITVDHTSLRHSSFCISPSSAPSGHIGVHVHAGASSTDNGQLLPREYDEHPHCHCESFAGGV